MLYQFAFLKHSQSHNFGICPWLNLMSVLPSSMTAKCCLIKDNLQGIICAMCSTPKGSVPERLLLCVPALSAWP